MTVNFSHKHSLLCLALACSCFVQAQDVNFSQPYSSPLYLNPAYSGIEDYTRIGANYQYQWGQLGEPYMSYSLYADHYFEDYKSGLGFCAVSDRQGKGAVVQSSLGASYAYNLQLAEKTFVRFGIQAILGITSVNASMLTFPDLINTDGSTIPVAEQYASEKKIYFDMALGSVFSHDIFYAGIALQHIMGSPEQEIMNQPINIPRKFTLHGGCNIPIDLGGSSSYRYSNELADVLTISPNVIYCLQGVYQTYGVGAYLGYRGFLTGLFYKSEVKSSSNFFSFCAGYTNDCLGIIYSFDVGKLSKETKAFTPNTHEISLVFKMKNRSKYGYGQRRNSTPKVQNSPYV